MSDLNKDVVNNTKSGQRDNLPKVRGRDRPVADIRTLVSSSNRGGESAEDKILQRSGMRLVSTAKRSVIGGSDRLFLIARGNRSLLTHRD
jgi:hypothetical protein